MLPHGSEFGSPTFISMMDGPGSLPVAPAPIVRAETRGHSEQDDELY